MFALSHRVFRKLSMGGVAVVADDASNGRIVIYYEDTLHPCSPTPVRECAEYAPRDRALDELF